MILIPAALEQYRGDGSAVSLPRSIVGKRHCRLLRLYHSDATTNEINSQFAK